MQQRQLKIATTVHRAGSTALAFIAVLAANSVAVVTAEAQAASAATPGTDSPAALEHVRAATTLAGTDLKTPLFLCRPDSTTVVRENAEAGSRAWLEPVRAFDNLYYVGNQFVGVWVLRTSAGLILFDSSTSADEAEHHLVPGLIKLGLKPADIKYVVVTHGHWDHFGGAAYLQQTYAAHVALSAADWDLIEKLPADSLERSGHPIPRRDITVTDGQILRVGDTSVTLYLTPGHTPGTVSALIPAKEAGRTHLLSLYGSVAFPSTVAPTDRTGGLRTYDESVQRFAEISRKAGAEGILNTHVFADGTLERLAAVQSRKPGATNPFLTGADFTHRYYGVLHECLLAAQTRPDHVNEWSKPPAESPAQTNSP